MNQFRGGLVCKAHRPVYYSTLGPRVIKKKKNTKPQSPKQVRTKYFDDFVKDAVLSRDITQVTFFCLFFVVRRNKECFCGQTNQRNFEQFNFDFCVRDSVLRRGITQVFFSATGQSRLNWSNRKGSKPTLTRLNLFDDLVRDAGLSRGILLYYSQA